jgi:hypothetical protein
MNVYKTKILMQVDKYIIFHIIFSLPYITQSSFQVNREIIINILIN